MPGSQPQQPANEDHPAQEPPQPGGEQPRQADGTVTPGACGPAQAQPNAEAPLNSEAPLNGDAPPSEPGWPDDEDELSGLVLVPGDEPVPAERVLLPEPAGGAGDGTGGGVCWSFGVDLDAILTAAAKGMLGPAGGQGTLAGLAGPAGSGPGGEDPESRRVWWCAVS